MGWCFLNPHVPSLIEIKKIIRGLVEDEIFSTLQTFSHRHKVAKFSLLLWKMFFNSFVPLVSIFIINLYSSCHVYSSNHFQSSFSGKTELHFGEFFPRTSTLWDRLLGHQHLNLLKSRADLLINALTIINI